MSPKKCLTLSFCSLLLLCLSGCDNKSSSPTPTAVATPGIVDLRVINADLFDGHFFGDDIGYFINGSDGTLLQSDTGVQWQATDTGYVRDALFDVAINPVSKVLVAVGDNGRIMRSVDKGKHWTPITSGVEASLRRIAFSQVSGCFLAVGELGAALLSCEDGKKWQRLEGFPEQSLLSVAAIDQSKEWMIGGEQNLWVSALAGTDWQPVALAEGHMISRIVSLPDQNLVLALTGDTMVIRRQQGEWTSQTLDLDPVYFSSLAASDKQLLITSSSGAVYLSSDWGEHWIVKQVDEDYLTRAVWLPQSQNFVAVGNNGAAYFSDADGGNWQKKALGFKGNFEGLLAANNGHAVAAFGKGGQFVNWDLTTGSTQVLQDHLEGFVQAMTWLPNGRLITAGSAGWLRYSDDGGRRWSNAEADIDETDYLFSLQYLPASGALLAAGPPGVILRSTDNGTRWTQVLRTETATEGYFHKLIVDTKRNWALAVAGPGIVQFSNDGGLSWQAADANTDKHLFNVVQNPETGVFIAVGGGGVVQRSEDGLHWQKQIIGKTDIQAIAYHRAKARWFIADHGGGLWTSADEGQTWNQMLEISGRSFYHIKPITDQRLLACGSKGLLLLSKNSGESWEIVDLELEENLREPVFTSKGQLFMSTRGGNILQSDNLGDTWQPLRTRTAESLKLVALSPQGDTLVAAGKRIVQLKMPR